MLTYTHTMHVYITQSQAQEYKLVFSHMHRVSDLERSPTGSVFRTRRHLSTWSVWPGQDPLTELVQDRDSHKSVSIQEPMQRSMTSKTTLLWNHDLDRELTYRVSNEYRGSSSGSLIRNDTHFRWQGQELLYRIPSETETFHSTGKQEGKQLKIVLESPWNRKSLKLTRLLGTSLPE